MKLLSFLVVFAACCLSSCGLPLFPGDAVSIGLQNEFSERVTVVVGYHSGKNQEMRLEPGERLMTRSNENRDGWVETVTIFVAGKRQYICHLPEKRGFWCHVGPSGCRFADD